MKIWESLRRVVSKDEIPKTLEFIKEECRKGKPYLIEWAIRDLIKYSKEYRFPIPNKVWNVISNEIYKMTERKIGDFQRSKFNTHSLKLQNKAIELLVTLDLSVKYVKDRIKLNQELRKKLYLITKRIVRKKIKDRRSLNDWEKIILRVFRFYAPNYYEPIVSEIAVMKLTL